MQSPRSLRALAPQLLALTLLATGILQPSPSQAQSSSSAEEQSSSSSSSTAPVQPEIQKPPSLIDPAGPQITLETSEAVFYIAVALNACGYDADLIVRAHPAKVREEMNEPFRPLPKPRTPVTTRRIHAPARPRRLQP